MSISKVIGFYSNNKRVNAVDADLVIGSKPDLDILPLLSSCLPAYLGALDTNATLLPLMSADEKTKRLNDLKQTLRVLMDLYEYEVNCFNQYANQQKYLGYMVKAIKLIALLEQKEEGVLAQYLNVLNTEEVLLQFMNSEQKTKKLKELKHTLRFLTDLYEYEVITLEKTTNEQHYQAHIAQAIKLISALEQKEEGVPASQPLGVDGKPVAYFFKEVGKEFAKGIDSTKGFLTGVNTKRLTWVWGSLLVQSLLEMMPMDYFNRGQAKQAATAASPVTGYASFILYYFRGSIDLYFLLKETYAEEGLTAGQRWERFKTLANDKKYALLNDWIWATGNMLTFFILTAKNGLGPWGDLLNLVLYIMDLSLSIAEFAEQQKAYEKNILEFDKKIVDLQESIKQLQTSEDPQDKELVASYTAQMEELVLGKTRCQKEWDVNKRNLIMGICYALGMLLGLALLITPVGPGLLVISLLGAVMCYAFTVIYKTINNYQVLGQAIENKQLNDKNRQDKLAELKALLAQEDSPENQAKAKFLYLELKQLSAASEEQRDLVTYQTMRFTRALMLEILLPVVFFVSFVYFPLGIGIAAFAAVLVIALASHFLIETLCKREKLGMELGPFLLALIKAGLTNVPVETLCKKEEQDMEPLDEEEYKANCNFIKEDTKGINPFLENTAYKAQGIFAPVNQAGAEGPENPGNNLVPAS